MEAVQKKRIAAFKASDAYQEVKDRLRMFVLRGQNPDLEEDWQDAESGFLNQIYQAHSAVQVVNILGYALNKPMAEFEKVDPSELEELLRNGDVCFIETEARKLLESVVKQMKSFSFTLIPLVVVKDISKLDQIYESLLIKVYLDGKVCDYVDISGRVYASFDQFLVKNKLPHSILCFPKDGLITFDEKDEIELDCRLVGVKNAILNTTDVVVGVVGAVGTVGAIFATGGLAVPLLAVSFGSAAYSTTRGVEKLVDASKHGKSLNPLQDSEARNNWLMVSANLLTFASMGATVGLTAAKIESLTATQIGRLLLANRILKGVSAGVNAVAVVDSVVYSVNNWKKLTIYEKISLACAVCFCFREVISFINAERLIRQSQFNGICKFFKRCTDSGCSILSTDSFMTNARRMFETNDEYLGTGLKLIRSLVTDNISVVVSEDFTTIRLFDYEFKMNNIIRMGEYELNRFLFMIQGIAVSFKDLFALMRKSFGDESIMSAVFKRSEELGGNRADYGKAINELLQVIELIRRISSDITVLTEAGLIIGNGHRFSIGSAFNTFIKIGIGKAIPLTKALVDMNPREVRRMNELRSQWGAKEGSFFEYIITNSQGSNEILTKIRFLLEIQEICTQKSLRITELHATDGTVEIESLVRVDPQLFFKAASRAFLIDPKFLRICEPAMCCYKSYLQTLWINTCVPNEPLDESFEKLITLETAFQRYPFSVENVVSYTSSMKCQNFSSFVYHALFALNNMERLMRERILDQAAANYALFSDNSLLGSRFLELKMKAEELSLGGYYPVDDDRLADYTQLPELIKTLAGNEVLRFGLVENAVLHLDDRPNLRLKSEIGKYNRFIALKKFVREEIQPVGDGGRKWMVYLANNQLQIVVGVIRGIGVYIDTFQFSCAN